MATSFSLFIIIFFFVFFLWSSSLSDASSLRYHLEEELPPETVVGNVKLDVSTRSNYSDVTLSRLRFRFQGPCDHFRLDNITGTISIRSRVDRDVICRHDDDDADSEPCVIECYVIVEPSEFYDVIAVEYVIGDVNDNPPQFPADAERHLEVSESVPVGTRFLLPTADDPDSAAFGVRSYVLESGSGQQQGPGAIPVPFQLDYDDPPGNELRLRVTGSLDRERVPGYSLRIAAVDGGNPDPRTGVLDLEVLVRDENDNPPRLAGENYEATLEENLPIGTRILQVRAEDPDQGRNGNLSFRFADDTMTSHGDVFGIDGRDGWIHVTGVVDYERDRSLVLTIVVADQGVVALTSYAKVAIYVSDVNDNDPVITVSSFEDRRAAEVHENRPPGTFVAHIAATDADGSDNGRVTCHIDSPHFRLVTVSGEPTTSEYQLVSASVFDREDRPQEALAMSCRDHGQPSRSASLMVSVWIADDNDNAPRFHDDDVTIRVVRLRENNAIGVTVTSYNVTDPDDGRNAAVDMSVEATGGYSSSTPPGALVVSEDGVVAANVVFDYEECRRHSFRIVATDRGVPPLSSGVQLDIEIEDVNDEPPVFDADSYVFRTRENLPPGTPVGRVRAIDRDSTPEFARIRYAFVDDERHLAIDPDTGEIVVVRALDREVRSSVTFKVRASNDPDFRSTLSGEVNAMLFVEDENDNAPVITFPNALNHTLTLSREVKVKVKVGTRVGRIEAFDADEGANSELTFSVNASTASGLFFFRVEPSTGWIFVAEDYDGDAFIQAGLVPLKVIVIDGGRPPRSSTETLVLAARGWEEEEEDEGGPVEVYGDGAVPTGIVLIAVGVGCGLLAVVVVLAVTLICYRIRSFKVKNRRSYNCRLEASKATTSNGRYRNSPRGNSAGEPSPLQTGNDESRVNRGTGKKGVRFSLDQESGPTISSPITDCRLACPFPEECAFHRHGIPPFHGSSPPSSVDGPPNTVDAGGPLANGNAYRPRHDSLGRYQRQIQPPIAIPNLQQRSLRKVNIPTVDQILKFDHSDVHQTGCEQHTDTVVSSSCPVGYRPSSAPEHWSNGSLPGQGRRPSDAEESGVFSSGSQEPFFPVESNV